MNTKDNAEMKEQEREEIKELGAEITVIGEFQSYEENGMTWYHLVNARLA